MRNEGEQAGSVVCSRPGERNIREVAGGGELVQDGFWGFLNVTPQNSEF
jgi:hypothetical protein